MTHSLDVRHLGLVPYAEALELQRSLADDRIAGRIPDTLLLLEHPPVITLGRGTKDASLPIDPAALKRRGIDVYEIERGGDVTYHGPGQLVGYPIIDLQQHKPDLHWYLRQLEATLIGALARFAIAAERREGYTGVWTSGRKIASIGIHVRQWVTWHGFALNVTTDLSPFELIVPCGIQGVEMTSVANERDGGTEGTEGRGGRRVDVTAGGAEAAEVLSEVRDEVVTSFRNTFSY